MYFLIVYIVYTVNVNNNQLLTLNCLRVKNYVDNIFSLHGTSLEPIQNKSSSIHKSIECTFTWTKNFIDIQNRFCLIKKKKNAPRTHTWLIFIGNLLSK